MAEQEYGKCECCGYTIDGKHYHSEMVSHCKDCVPIIPDRLHVSLRCEMDNNEYMVEIFGMKADKIKGEFCIE